MHDTVRQTLRHPMIALGGTVLWGLVELAALWRSRWSKGAAPKR